MKQFRQYVACEFSKGGRSYTYQNDGEQLGVGDRVVVETPRGEQVVTVISILDEAPPFATKAVLATAPAPAPAAKEGLFE